MQSIDSKQFILAAKQLAEEKNLPMEVVQGAIEHAVASAYRKDYESKDTEVRASVNLQKAEMQVYVQKEVVEEVEDEHTQISPEDAKKHDEDVEVGETLEYSVEPKEFGRVAAQTAKQVILQKLREAEREIVQEEYEEKVGTILNGIVQRYERRTVYIDVGRASGIMPLNEQIQSEHYSSGQRLKFYLKDVSSESRGPQLILSRADANFIVKLFEREVPEMENDAVKIEAIAREAGVRTKVAVSSNVPGVDPVGTFVGGHGTRVQAVMSEIGDTEKIDIIEYDEDTVQFIENALSPTEITEIEIVSDDEEEKKAVVKVKEDQLSIAIGRKGQNVRIASKLTGYELDIQEAKPEGEEEQDESTPQISEEVSEGKEVESESETDKDTEEENEPQTVQRKPKKTKTKKNRKFVSKAEHEKKLLSTLEQSGTDNDDEKNEEDQG